MQLTMPAERAAGYKSLCQKARVVSEGWGEENLFCCNCDSPSLRASAANTEAFDFACPRCSSVFQLKSQARNFSERLVDAAYGAMRRAILEDRTPNLVAIHYDRQRWLVQNAILIPRFAFSMSAVEKRAPLAATARRAGWVGCNILLSRIPPEARINLVRDGVATDARRVRQQYALLRPLENIRADSRGWTLDVLRIVRSLSDDQFTLADVYKQEGELKKLHPGNRHMREKIRQQLQRLRDLGLVQFLGRGVYSTSEASERR